MSYFVHVHAMPWRLWWDSSLAKQSIDSRGDDSFDRIYRQTRHGQNVCLRAWWLLCLNRARVLQNQNPFQERATGKWCKGRLPRNFSHSTRATSGGTRAIALDTFDINWWATLFIFFILYYSYQITNVIFQKHATISFHTSSHFIRVE